MPRTHQVSITAEFDVGAAHTNAQVFVVVCSDVFQVADPFMDVWHARLNGVCVCKWVNTRLVSWM